MGGGNLSLGGGGWGGGGGGRWEWGGGGGGGGGGRGRGGGGREIQATTPPPLRMKPCQIGVNIGSYNGHSFGIGITTDEVQWELGCIERYW